MKDDMFDTLDNVKRRVMKALELTNKEDFNNKMDSIKGPVLVCGVGGSSVAADFIAKVLNKKNGLVAIYHSTRDLEHLNLDNYQSVISCSFSGKNVGVDQCFNNNLEKYCISNGNREDAINLHYEVEDYELSFVSMADTFIPMALALRYYGVSEKEIEEILTIKEDFTIENGEVFEIFMGQENCVAAKMLESTMCEGGIGTPVIHEKYNFCHGRINLNERIKGHQAIYFDRESELDEILKKGLLPRYQNVIVLKNKYEDEIINDFYLSYVSLLLCIELAKIKNIDISIKVIPPVSDELYLFKGKC